jgi:3-hydroxyacyl-[acyl-carrier-protein] dehydratase
MRWHWIDQIVHHEPGLRLVAIKHVSLAEDHLHDHFSANPGAGLDPLPLMPASLMIEGMAQTAGILVGSVNQFREKVILAKIVAATFDAEVQPGQTIRYDATIERMDPAGAATVGVVERCHAADGCWEPIGRIALLFSHIDNNMSGRDFPEHNFVFGDNFKVLLGGMRSAVAIKS